MTAMINQARPYSTITNTIYRITKTISILPAYSGLLGQHDVGVTKGGRWVRIQE